MMQAHYRFDVIEYDRKRWALAGATLATIAGTIGTLAIGGGAAIAAPGVSRSMDVAAKKRKQLASEDEKKRAVLLAGIPQPGDAQAKARSEIEKRRRITALAGGKTLLTTETGIGTGPGGKTLLGA
jgi:hypothetical protein